MQWILAPIARSQGVKSASKLQRFMEQGWLVIYYVIGWSIGMWIMSNSPHWFNRDGLWDGFPFIWIKGEMKRYYLVQLAFWIQQLLIVNVEERRKDFTVMVAHHLFTITLMIGSYMSHATPVGNAVLCCMDFADIFLSAAKVFNYIKWSRTTDGLFVIFVVGWIITRHYYFLIIIYSAYADMPRFGAVAWDPETERYIGYYFHRFYIGLLLGLQVLCIYWFWLVIGVIRRVLAKNKIADTRSDDEGSDAESSSKQH
jgi:acyl-CoA-dependent ceramide synthase